MQKFTEQNLGLLTGYYVVNRANLVKRFTRRAGTEWDAEDVVQDAFERAIKYYDSYDPELSAFGAWFGRIITNALRNYLNRQKGLGDLEFDEELAEGTPCEQYTEHLAADIRANIRTRKKHIAEILILYFEKGYSAKDISCIVDTSHVAINQIIYRFREEIRKEFKDGGTLSA